MSNEEFEEIFGNVPFETINKINNWVNKHYVSKDKIREFIKEELPDNEIMECCNRYDINGIDIRKKLERLL